MILYTENPNNCTKKQQFSQGNKINIQKLVVFLYTNNELSEKDGNDLTYNSIKNNKNI